MKRLLLLVLCGAGVASADAELPAQAKRWADAVRPAAREQKWKLIPWTTDFGEAVKTAKAEKRPLVIWTSGDEPLDRC